MASEDIIERLSTRFSTATQNLNTPDIGTRNIGGSQRQNHPYISGYFQAMFKLPEVLFAKNNADAVKYLVSTCESFTPPSETINYAELNGLGQVKSRFYTSRNVTNDISLAFREYTNMPIMNILSSWVGFIDPFVGASSLKGSQFLPSAYKGTLYVLQTKPVGAFGGNAMLTEEDIEESWIFDGVWPTSLPYDSFNSDLTSADSIQITANFSFDGYPFKASEGATPVCLDLYNSLGFSYGHSFDQVKRMAFAQ